MEIKSITRIDGKIRIVSANSSQERVDDFEDYGLPEIDYLIKSFLEHNILVEKSGLYDEDRYRFGDCYYVSNHYIDIRGPKSKAYKYLRINKSITTIDYDTFTCIIYGCARFTTNIVNWNWSKYSWLYSKKFVKQFNGRHITVQSLKKYGAAIDALSFSCRRMEVIIIRCRLVAQDLHTKL